MDKPSIQKILDQQKTELFDKLSLPLFQIKALEKMSACRTAALGAHAEYCENGHLDGVWYNSCRNRSCPQCQNLAKTQWLENVQRLLLDCPHHHVIFTIPHEFNTLWRHNRALMTQVLFKAAQQTLKTFAADPKLLGATPGILSALHTWGRNLALHPHLHVLISHGGLDANNQWRRPKKDKLFPQKAVMIMFRGKFRALVREHLESGDLALPRDCAANQIKSLLNKLGRKDWTVHFCNQYVHGKGVAKYLARYVKGGAFNNQQIKRVDDGKVRFLYKSHQTGLYSTSGRERLDVARAALGQEPVPEKAKIQWQEYLKDLGYERKCRHCQSALVRREPIPPKRSA